MRQNLNSQSRNHLNICIPQCQTSPSIARNEISCQLLRFVLMEARDGSAMSGVEDVGIEELRSKRIYHMELQLIKCQSLLDSIERFWCWSLKERTNVKSRAEQAQRKTLSTTQWDSVRIEVERRPSIGSIRHHLLCNNQSIHPSFTAWYLSLKSTFETGTSPSISQPKPSPCQE